MSAPAKSELLARARDIVPLLAAEAAAGRAACRLSDRSISAMREAGLFRLLEPAAYGGYEADPRVVYESEMILGEADMSAAWILGVSGVISWLAALFDARAAQDIWGRSPDAVFCCAFRRNGVAAPVEGGFRLSGRWTYASGCQHSQWAAVGALRGVEKPGPDDHLLLLVPRADFEIIDTWRSPGMQGTGSHDIAVKDAFVPAHRVIRFIDNLNCMGPGQSTHTAPIYRMPFGQIFGAGVSVAAIGAMQAMLDAYVKLARERMRMGASLADDPDAQAAAAEAWSAIDFSKLVIDRNYGEMLADAQRGVVTPIEARLKYKYQMSQITDRCRSAAQKIGDLAGTAGLTGGALFHRLMADIAAGRQHITNQTVLHARDLGWRMFGLKEKLDFML